LATYLYPEKTECAVVCRGDRMPALLAISFQSFVRLVAEAHGAGVDVKQAIEGDGMGPGTNKEAEEKEYESRSRICR
jgi:hypothetical protein